jgi:protein ImuA
VEDRPDRTICLEELRRRIARLEAARPRGGYAAVTSGTIALDNMLPERGFRCGTLVEWLSAGEGMGACTLALLAARAACRHGGSLVVLDRRGDFYPPAAVRLGIEPEQLLVVRAENAADHDWAMDQVLRSPATAAVLAWPERLDGRTFRRWQLAGEQSGGLGLLLRPAAARAEPSWADVRLLVEPLPDNCATACSQAVLPPTSESTLLASKQWHTPLNRKRPLRIVLLRCRGGTDGRSVEVELDDETYRVYSVAERRLQIGKCKLQIAN